MKVFPSKTKSHLESRLFFDGGVDVARYDKVKYPVFEGFTKQQLSFFWRPEEFEIYRDIKDFKALSSQEQHIFTSNLKRQILLDSVQGRGPVSIFGQIASLPELETWLTTWQFFETIHSRSYTHIIKNIYNDPSKVFDQMLDIQELIDCTDNISKYYDKLSEWNNIRDIKDDIIDLGLSYDKKAEYEHKKALWLALVSVNVLEGIRFYVSFACSWAFAETKRMEGNAKIIKFIARDENLHLGSTQQLIKILPKDDPDFIKIREETQEESINIVRDGAEQEIVWVDYLFKEGSMVGLNDTVLKQYVYWRTNKVLKGMGYPEQYKTGSNPLPWTQKWIAGSDVQVAPQEVTVENYTVGGIKQDLTPENVKKLRI